MEQRISIITLGVKDLKKARDFYDSLGWQVSSEEQSEKIVCYNMIGFAFSLYPLEKFSEEVQRPDAKFALPSFTLAHNVSSKKEVAKILFDVEKSGGKIVVSAQDVFWGGHSGKFTDLDGYLWEVAYNPFSPLGSNGEFQWGGAV